MCPLATFSRPLSSPSTGCGFVNDNRKIGFHDLRKLAPDKAGPAGAGRARLGLIGRHDGRREYWIPGPTFKTVAGARRKIGR